MMFTDIEAELLSTIFIPNGEEMGVFSRLFQLHNSYQSEFLGKVHLFTFSIVEDGIGGNRELVFFGKLVGIRISFSSSI